MKKLLLAGIALLAMAPGARAGILAQYSVNGGATFTTLCSAASGTSCGSTGAISDGLSFTLFGVTSNSPGTPQDANLLSATVRLLNPTNAVQSVVLLIGDTGFMQPHTPPPVSLLNSIAGTVVTGGGTNVFTSQACLSNSNAQNACPGSIESPLITANITLPGVGAQSNNTAVTNLSAPFSMTELLHITLDPGSNINFSASSDVVPVPEPSAMLALGIGMLGLGFVANKKRNI